MFYNLAVAGVLITAIVLVVCNHRLQSSAATQNNGRPSVSKNIAKTGQTSTPTAGSSVNSTPSPTSTQNVKQEDPYAGWGTYTNPIFNYTIKYPSGWSKAEQSQSVFVTLASTDKPDATISITGIKINTAPSKLLDLSGRTVFDSNETPINGYETYSVRFGDSTYVNRCDIISHVGTIAEICMTETATKPPTDNSKYVSQFDLIAESLKF
jgi:hypothetical protein